MSDLAAYALSLLLRQPIYFEDREAPGKRAQLEQLSRSIARATNEAWVAKALVVIGRFETGFSLRVQSGECRRNECDKGRAAASGTSRELSTWAAASPRPNGTRARHKPRTSSELGLPRQRPAQGQRVLPRVAEYRRLP